jgi:hypothetical protein
MEFFDFFCKISFFECNHSKTVSAAGVFQDMKNVKKIAIFSEFKSRFEKSW